MTKETEVYRRLMNSIRYKEYKLGPNICFLETGDTVWPETVIGFHHETGLPVSAGIGGQVVKVLRDPVNDTVMMLAVAENYG